MTIHGGVISFFSFALYLVLLVMAPSENLLYISPPLDEYENICSEYTFFIIASFSLSVTFRYLPFVVYVV